jgi:hypothetical protein
MHELKKKYSYSLDSQLMAEDTVGTPIFCPWLTMNAKGLGCDTMKQKSSKIQKNQNQKISIAK